MKNAEEFNDYVKLSKELQHVPVENLNLDESKAFFINIYNALVIHATVMNGPPSNWFSRFRVSYSFLLALWWGMQEHYHCIPCG